MILDPAAAQRAAFLPKLVTTLAEGYGLPQLRADLLAGLTVAIVALPLSMAIAIASGVEPERGLYTAIVGGFLVSALGGSRFQIGGPAGAFIVLVAATVAQHGVDGLILATMLSGVMMVAAGLLRLGTFVRFIPYPVTVGFTAGIATIIFASQLVPLLGLTLAGPEPGPLLEKLPALWRALPTLNPATVALSAGSVLALVALKRFRPHWPRMLIVVAGGRPRGLGARSRRGDDRQRLRRHPERLPCARAAAGGLGRGARRPAERLQLRAPRRHRVAAVGGGGRRHDRTAAPLEHRAGRPRGRQRRLRRSSAASASPAPSPAPRPTCAPARTGRSRASRTRCSCSSSSSSPRRSPPTCRWRRSPPCSRSWPGTWSRSRRSGRCSASWGDAVVLLVTLGLTLFRGLSEAIVVGFALGAVLFINRMAQAVEVAETPRAPYRTEEGADPAAVVFRVTGAMFFGAVSAVGTALDRIGDEHRVLVIDFAGVTLVNSSAANMVEVLAAKARRRGVAVYLSAAAAPLRRTLLAHGARPPLVRYAPSIESALAAARRRGELPPREGGTELTLTKLAGTVNAREAYPLETRA